MALVTIRLQDLSDVREPRSQQFPASDAGSDVEDPERTWPGLFQVMCGTPKDPQAL